MSEYTPGMLGILLALMRGRLCSSKEDSSEVIWLLRTVISLVGTGLLVSRFVDPMCFAMTK